MDGDKRIRMQEWLDHLQSHRITRRDALRATGQAGLVALAAANARWLITEPAAAAQSATIVSWTPAGQRWEYPQKGVYPLFQQKFPDIKVQFLTEAIADIIDKETLAIGNKSDRYDVVQAPYQANPQFIARGALEPIQPYIDKDPAFKQDILSDIPENILDLYRDKPAKQGGILYGLPPDSNCMLQWYRADIFDKAGIKKAATTWDEAVEISKELSSNGKQKVVGAPLKRGEWAAEAFITMLHTYGGDLFDKMGPGGWHVTIDSEAGHLALNMLLKFKSYMDPASINAADDEANTAMLNGSWVYAPFEWAGSTMNDPKFTKYSNEWKVDIVPKGTGPKARYAPNMGGLGLVIPINSHHKDAAWEWLKFVNYGDKEDPRVGKAYVENTGQPARISFLSEYSNIRSYFAGLAKSLPHAMRNAPIPEFYDIANRMGTEISIVVTGGKSVDRSLKDMQNIVTGIMTKGGYYKK